MSSPLPCILPHNFFPSEKFKFQTNHQKFIQNKLRAQHNYFFL